MKKKININEIVNEVVKDNLNEISKSQKKRNADNIVKSFKGKLNKRGINVIQAIAVFTAFNPDSKKMPNKFNKNANHSLKKDLKDSQYTIVPCIGNFANSKENSYAVINIDRDTAAYFNGKYQQTSFVYSVFQDDDTVHSEYWEKQDVNEPYDPAANPYVIKDTCDTWIDMADAKTNFTIVGKKFKYSIPFSIFENVNNQIIDNISKWLIKENKKVDKDNIISEIKFGYQKVGYPAYFRRKICNHNLNNLI